jgi:Flp pilus assembly protein TadB
MTLALSATLRNPVIWGSPLITDIAVIYVIVSSIGYCLVWGFADGIFYVFENYHTVKRKNEMIDYAKLEEKRSRSHDMVEEDLEDSVFNVVNDEDKKKIIDAAVANLAKSEQEKHPPYKESATIILADMGLNGGAAFVILVPIILALFGLYVQTALYLSWTIAVALMFGIGLWVEESSVLAKKLKYGLYYAALALFILVLVIVLTSVI